MNLGLNLEQQMLLYRAIPPLAKLFGFSGEEGWQILINQNGSLNELLSQRNDSGLRKKVNEWWKNYRSDFPKIGLGILQRVSRPAKLEEPTYDQLICLVWLTDKLSAEQLVREQKRIAEEAKAKKISVLEILPNFFLPNLWQSIFKCFQNLLKRARA